MAVGSLRGVQMAVIRPVIGMPTMSTTFNQLTCLYQFFLVKGVSVICGFFGSYLVFRTGSWGAGFDIGSGCVERNSGLTAGMPLVG